MSPQEISKEPVMPSQVESQTTGSPIASQKKKKPKRVLGKILNIILIIAVAALGYMYYEKRNELKMLRDPAAAAEVARKEAVEVAAQASQIALLPEGDEVPEVLTINDAELAIKEQPNLAGVITGDKILLYVTSGKAIVYSPSRNKIVNILPVVLQRPQGGAASGTNTTQTSSNSTSQGTSTSE